MNSCFFFRRIVSYSIHSPRSALKFCVHCSVIDSQSHSYQVSLVSLTLSGISVGGTLSKLESNSLRKYSFIKVSSNINIELCYETVVIVGVVCVLVSIKWQVVTNKYFQQFYFVWYGNKVNMRCLFFILKIVLYLIIPCLILSPQSPITQKELYVSWICRLRMVIIL